MHHADCPLTTPTTADREYQFSSVLLMASIYWYTKRHWAPALDHAVTLCQTDDDPGYRAGPILTSLVFIAASRCASRWVWSREWKACPGLKAMPLGGSSISRSIHACTKGLARHGRWSKGGPIETAVPKRWCASYTAHAYLTADGPKPGNIKISKQGRKSYPVARPPAVVQAANCAIPNTGGVNVIVVTIPFC